MNIRIIFIFCLLTAKTSAQSADQARDDVNEEGSSDAPQSGYHGLSGLVEPSDETEFESVGLEAEKERKDDYVSHEMTTVDPSETSAAGAPTEVDMEEIWNIKVYAAVEPEVSSGEGSNVNIPEAKDDPDSVKSAQGSIVKSSLLWNLPFAVVLSSMFLSAI